MGLDCILYVSGARADLSYGLLSHGLQSHMVVLRRRKNDIDGVRS